MKTYFQAVALLLLLTPAAQAEPNRVPSWLMNEPMSLWDWGIYRTDKRMQEIKELPSLFKAKFFSGSATYDWDENRIKLFAMFVGESTEAGCIEHIKKTKGAFLMYKWEPKEQIVQAPNTMASLFSHEGGYQSKGQPKDMGEQLASITVMEVMMSMPDGMLFKPGIRCTSPLGSASISIIKN